MVADENRLRRLALTLLQERIVTITRQWEAGIITDAQHKTVELEVDRVVGSALQVHLPEIAHEGRVVQRHLTRRTLGSAMLEETDQAITEALHALQCAIAQATHQYMP